MTNFNRMTIRTTTAGCAVFKMKRQQLGGYATDLQAKRFIWSVPSAASPRFEGTYGDCLSFIARSGAEFMSEHGIAC